MAISPTTFWLILALILAGLEMLSGTFYLLAISVGMACGALAAWIGLSLPTQMIIAAIVGIIAVIALHRWRRARLPACGAQCGHGIRPARKDSRLAG